MIEDAMAAVRSLVLDSVVMDVLGESTAPVDADGVTWTAAKRVVINRIPDALIAASDTYHPPKIVVLRQGGGQAATDELPIETERVLALCYGESQKQADRVRRALHHLFKFVCRAKFDSVLIHHMTKAGGPVSSHDPDIVWPAVSQAYNLTADIEEAA